MNNEYIAEILRATGSLQSGDPAGVTAIVQNALAIAGLTGSVGQGAPANLPLGIQVPQALLQPGLSEHLAPRTDRLRKPLSEVVSALKAGGMVRGLEGLPGLGQPGRAPDLPLPDGASFLVWMPPSLQGRFGFLSM